MRFLVDAQLPRRFASWLNEQGYDAIHTLDLPSGNRTPDADIVARSAREHRVVVTKDSDFVESYLLYHQPERLLLISTGNIHNAELQALLLPNLATIVTAFASADFIELTRDGVVVHG